MKCYPPGEIVTVHDLTGIPRLNAVAEGGGGV